MLKLRELILVSLLLFAVASACTPPGGPEIESVELSDISIEDAAAATVKAMSVASDLPPIALPLIISDL